METDERYGSKSMLNVLALDFRNQNMAKIQDIDEEGRFDNLLGITDLCDKTCLIYETQPIFEAGGIARVTRVGIEDGNEYARDTLRYGEYNSKKEIIRKLNDWIIESD